MEKIMTTFSAKYRTYDI